MNRIEFMNELAYLLQDIQEEERQEALQYYNDYFDEAGNENEASLIAELESPEKVAAIIKDGLGDEVRQTGEYSEKGYEDERFSTRQQIDRRTYLRESDYNYQNFRSKRQNDQSNRAGCQEQSRTGNSGLKIILVIVLCIAAIPFGATVLGLLAGLAGIVIGICAGTIGLLIAGVALIGAGIAELFIIPSAGLAIGGIGLLLVAVALLGIILIAWMAGKVIPGFFRWFTGVCRRPFRQKGEV